MKYVNSLLLMFVFAVAGITAAEASAGQRALDARAWDLIELNGQVVRNSKASLEIDLDAGRFSGNTGCNNMFGKVTSTGARISFEGIGSTRRFCGGGANQIENKYLKALGAVTRFNVRGNSLELLDRSRVVMRFKAGAGSVQDRKFRLEDKKWMLTAIKGTPVSKAGRSAFVVFDKQKGSAGGNSSCNVFGGNYKVNGDKIAITELISTMMACEEGGKMQIERDMLNGLERANSFEIKGGKLMLYRAKRLLLTFEAADK